MQGKGKQQYGELCTSMDEDNGKCRESLKQEVIKCLY
jgi:hypothetical protein